VLIVLVPIGLCLGQVGGALQEGVALNDLQNQGFDCISILLGVCEYFIDIASVGPL
jgi:hypothetical protein